MRDIPTPKCDCGTTIGLFFKHDRWWCANCVWNLVKILRDALLPFTHPDLSALRSGNSGEDSIVFQRDHAYLRIVDFKRAAEAAKKRG